MHERLAWEERNKKETEVKNRKEHEEQDWQVEHDVLSSGERQVRGAAFVRYSKGKHRTDHPDSLCYIKNKDKEAQCCTHTQA
eukprot:15191573-Heterocapsa_arctica.AAC.1